MKRKDLENIAKAEMLLKESKEDFTKRAQKKANELNKTIYIWYVNHPYKSEGRWAMDIKEPTNLRSQGSAFFTVEPEISKSVIEILKVVAPTAQGDSSQAEATRFQETVALNQQNILTFEKDIISAAFTNYTNSKPNEVFSGFIIEFDKNNTAQNGEVTKVATKRAIRVAKKAYALKYNITLPEIMRVTGLKEKPVKKMLPKIFKLISDEWKKEGYTVEGEGTTKITMVHADAQNTAPPPPPPPPDMSAQPPPAIPPAPSLPPS